MATPLTLATWRARKRAQATAEIVVAEGLVDDDGVLAFIRFAPHGQCAYGAWAGMTVPVYAGDCSHILTGALTNEVDLPYLDYTRDIRR